LCANSIIFGEGKYYFLSPTHIYSKKEKGRKTMRKMGKKTVGMVLAMSMVMPVTCVQGAPAEKEVSYYSFEGDRVEDVWGDRDSLAQGAVFAEGKVGRALRIQGGEGVELPGDLNLGDAWSIGYWVYLEQSTGGRCSVITDKDGVCSFDNRISEGNTWTGVHVGAGDQEYLSFDYRMPVQQWVHVLWTNDRETGLCMYVNGQLVESNAWTKKNQFTAPVGIVGGEGFDGKVDELRIYSKALTAEEAAAEVERKLEIQYTIPQYKLPEQYLKDIERAPETPRQYLGQPDMIMLDDQKTLFTAYPIGHGCGPLVMQVSKDAGETWEEKTNIPESWKYSLETPTMYKLNMTDGSTKLIMITGRPNWHGNQTGGWNTSVSVDNGETWSEYQTFHPQLNGRQNWTIVAMASLTQMKDANGNWIDQWMGVYHDYNFVNYKTYLTFDDQGREVWSEPEPYLAKDRDIEQSHQICEVGLFRSPDGKRIVGLGRSQSHQHKSVMFYSDDEGKTWSRPQELQGALQGERHKAVYDPVSGKLLIVFRETTLDQNKNGVIERDDWVAGDWVAWVGTYDDLMAQREGEYRILLSEDWSNSPKSGDTGYTGIVVKEDGTFIMDSYGHWDKEFSEKWGAGKVTSDLCYIRQAKFTLGDLEQAFSSQANQ